MIPTLEALPSLQNTTFFLPPHIRIGFETSHLACNMSALSRTPAEVLEMILKDTRRNEIKNLRLVSRHLNVSLIPLVFDRVFVSFNDADIEAANAILDRYGEHVRTVIISPTLAISRRSINADLYHDLQYWSGSLISKERLETCHKLYSAVFARQRQNLKNGAHEMLIRKTFSASSHVGSIVLTDAYCRHDYALNVITDPNGKHCFAELKIPLLENDQVTPPISSGLCLCKLLQLKNIAAACEWSTSWPLVMANLASSQYNRSITVNMMRGATRPTNFQFLPVLLPAKKAIDLVFARLKILHLDLKNGIQIYSSKFNASVLQTFVTATNLEYLYVRGKRFVKPAIHLRFGERPLPKLQTLVLQDILLNERELMNLIHASPQLQTLMIIGAQILHEGDWAKILEKIRAALPKLHSVEITELHGQFGNFRGEWRDFDSEVDAFFFAGGANPCTPLHVAQTAQVTNDYAASNASLAGQAYLSRLRARVPRVGLSVRWDHRPGWRKPWIEEE